MRTKLLTIIGLVLVLGACGTAAAKESAPKKAVVHMRPAATEYKAPPECGQALDEAEQVFGYSAEFAGIVQRIMATSKDAVTAAADSDVSGIQQATSEIESETSDINDVTAKTEAITPDYKSHAATCRAG